MNSELDPQGLRLPIKLDTHDQRRVRADPARTGAPRGAAPGAGSRTRQRAAPGPRPAPLPGVGLRRRHDAARHERGLRAAPARAAASSSVPRRRRSTSQLARRRRGRQRVHLRRAGPLRESDRRVAEAPAGRREAARLRHGRRALQAAPGPGRLRLPALRRAGPVREGRLHGLGHRPHGAVVRALDARRRAAHDRGGGGDRAHRREARGHAPALHPRAREPEPAGRPRGHGRARRAPQDRGVEDLHAVRARRHGLLHGRRARASR